MDDLPNQDKSREHPANERTLLAWVRTCIGIMAFGFVVVKFSLLVKQVSLMVGKETIVHQHSYSGAMGIVLVAVGGVIAGLSYVRYRQTEKQLNEGYYKHSSLFIIIVIGFILLVSAVLLVYLFNSI